MAYKKRTIIGSKDPGAIIRVLNAPITERSITHTLKDVFTKIMTAMFFSTRVTIAPLLKLIPIRLPMPVPHTSRLLRRLSIQTTTTMVQPTSALLLIKSASRIMKSTFKT